jgi:hypothetical protein
MLACIYNTMDQLNFDHDICDAPLLPHLANIKIGTRSNFSSGSRGKDTIDEHNNPTDIFKIHFSTFPVTFRCIKMNEMLLDVIKYGRFRASFSGKAGATTPSARVIAFATSPTSKHHTNQHTENTLPQLPNKSTNPLNDIIQVYHVDHQFHSCSPLLIAATRACDRPYLPQLY